MVTNEERAQRYADAVYDIAVDHPMWIDADSQPLDYNPRREEMLIEFIDEAQAAVIALADAEQAELRAEVERLQGWKSEATEVILGLQDLGRALGMRLGERITGESATEAAKRLTGRAEAAEAKVARVEALHDKWATARNVSDGRPNPVLIGISAMLRAALDGAQ